MKQSHLYFLIFRWLKLFDDIFDRTIHYEIFSRDELIKYTATNVFVFDRVNRLKLSMTIETLEKKLLITRLISLLVFFVKQLN